jgi:hypothetical protein
VNATGMHEQRRTAMGATFLVVGVAALVALPVMLTFEAKPRRRHGAGQFLWPAIEAFHAQRELRDGSDIVVDRLPSGALVVSGRALDSKLHLSTTRELSALLRSLPGPGVAVVTIGYEQSAGGVQGLVSPRPAEARRAEGELWAVLEEAGFHPARGRVKTFPPWSQGQSQIDADSSGGR